MKNNFNPRRSSADNRASLREADKEIFFVNTGPRDTGQSDYKNRLSFKDLIGLAPLYEEAGFFAVEMHGGARFHQDLMHNKVSPFDEARAWKERLDNTFTQTLIRSTNAFGYRAYPKNVIEKTVEAFLPTIDIWRCFDFLNHVPNMIFLGQVVLEGGKIFEPAISFTDSPGRSDKYYMGVAQEMITAFGGEKSIILAIKDMAGTGSPARISRLVDSMLQKWPDLVINYHRHTTDGLAVPALVEAAVAGAKILDVTDDAFTRFYGQAPVRAVAALLEERGLTAHVEKSGLEKSNEHVRSFIRNYDIFESPYKGLSYDVISHRMPGGAFPSSFEQAEKGGFLDLMPAILKGMSLGNKIIRYFDVTPGSQITWTTWAAIIQSAKKGDGDKGVELILDTLERFIRDGKNFDKTSKGDQQILLSLFEGGTDDLKSLLLGGYGPLPFGWPADWVYRSVFGEEWKKIVKKERKEKSRALDLKDEDLEAARARLEEELGRAPSEEDFVLYLQHPQATIDFIKFREKFGDSTTLPTQVWFEGLKECGDIVDFELGGKPQRLELVSVGETGPDGIRHIVLSVNNSMMVFKVEMPEAASVKTVLRMADTKNPGQIGAMIKGNLWRIGNKDRTLAVGDFVHKGEEVANLEVMKTENAVLSEVSGTVTEIVSAKNDAVDQNQLLLVIEPGEEPETTVEEQLRID